MTTATPDLPAMAVEKVTQAVIAALRPEEFRRLWRKAHAALRTHGYGEGHQRGAAKALRVAFPEYAHLIPERLERYGEETIPADLETILGRPVTPGVPAPGVTPLPTLVITEDDDEDEECEHEDHPWRCTRCDGLYADDCGEHNECVHCNRSCDACGLDPDCRHNYRCEGCEEEGVG